MIKLASGSWVGVHSSHNKIILYFYKLVGPTNAGGMVVVVVKGPASMEFCGEVSIFGEPHATSRHF
jgi:hypothetical protein